MWAAKALLIALQLLVLHRADGGEVTINADQITSLRAPAGAFHGLAPFAHCLVFLADGKFIGVVETCREVKSRLEEAGR